MDEQRLRRLQEIKDLGIESYPYSFNRTHTSKNVHEMKDLVDLSELKGEEEKHSLITLAGRIMLRRLMGKIAFVHLQDYEGMVQVMCSRDRTCIKDINEPDRNPLHFLEKQLDLGDWIGVQGYVFLTQKGEITLDVRELCVLSKALRPLPDKHSGLADKEVRYRKRWLDLISHREVMDTFLKRSKILSLTRRFFEEKHFLEVETPILNSLYGGAEARPFTTHLNARSQDMFLRISLEIGLKKLIVGGFDRVFELGKVFRNEGIDRTHNPEFTMLEAYAVHWDYNDMMNLVEHLFSSLAKSLSGTTKLTFGSQEVDLSPPWTRLTMKESIYKFKGIDIDQCSTDELRRLSPSTEGGIETLPRGLLIAHLFEEWVEPNLIQPCHITDHPLETTPLCKLHRAPSLRKEGFVERFESFIGGKEMCNAYSELNDPLLQRKLLEDQEQKRASGDEEAHPSDEEFIESIEQGMPPTGGIGIGIDRLVMLLTQEESIRDVLFFPIMRERH